MVKYLFLVVFGVFLVSSCAMQGSINGGPTDKNAPYFLQDKCIPSSGTTEFKSNEIKLRVNEFYRLNEPTTSIFIVPATVKVIPIAKDRELTLKLEGDLKDSTTYAIYFNKSIKDIHEGNDSLLTYVFSTGKFIDSLTYSGKVIDAFKRIPVAKLTMSLIPDTATTFSQKALYFCTTDQNGIFQFKYIKQGKYKLVAFMDGNNDLVPQNFEYTGFSSSNIDITTSKIDSIPIVAFPSKPKKFLRTTLFQAPAYFTISANENLKSAKFFHDGKEITSKINYHSSDSISFYHSTFEKDTLQLFIEHANKIDTLYIKTFEKERKKSPKIISTTKRGWNQAIDIEFTDEVVSFLQDSIKVYANDSLPVKGSFVVVDGMLRYTYPWSDGWKKISFKFLSTALIFKNFKEKFKLEWSVDILDEKQVGTLRLITKDVLPASIIELLKDGKVVHRHTVNLNEKEHVIDYLEKGDYGVRWIDDVSKNGLWDTGQLELKIQPEGVRIFKDTIVIRPNWEIEIVLSNDKWL